MKIRFKILLAVALACLPAMLNAASAPAGSPAASTALKAPSDPAVRSAAARLRSALKALEAVMLAKDGFISPAFKHFEVGEIRTPGVTAPMLTAAELKRLHAAFEAVQGTPELYAYVKAKHAYLNALREAQTAS